MASLNWTTTEVEVRYKETDQMGVVHHANYLVWFELGRTNHIKQFGFTYRHMEEKGVLLPVINVQISYKRPCHYGEVATIKTKLKKYDGVRIVFYYEVFNENGDLAVSGETEHTFVNNESFKPIMLRKRHRNWHDLFLNEVKERI